MKLNTKVVSPEEIHVKNQSRSRFWKLVNLITGPGISAARRWHLRRKHSLTFDPRRIDWDWSSVRFNRISAVNLVLQKFHDPRYLEIGCAENKLFDAVPVLNKVGVDPAWGGNVRLTSDEFFGKNEQQFDVVFIDGLHTYEQVHRDVANALKVVPKGGFILMHDLLPSSWAEQLVPQIESGDWTGDVWKASFEIAATYGLEFKILKIDHGVGVIKVNESNVELRDLSSQLTEKNFSYLFDNLGNLPIVDWTDAYDWLRAR